MLQQAKDTLFQDDPGMLSTLPYKAGGRAGAMYNTLAPKTKQQDQSHAFTGHDETTALGSTQEMNKTAEQQLGTQRSLSVQPTGGLPQLVAPKQHQPTVLGKFQSMVYNRNYVLNIDNSTTNRNNQNYLSGYYKQADVIPKQEALNYHSLRSLKYKQQQRSTSVVNQFEASRLLNKPSELHSIELKQVTKFPQLDSQLVACLNQGMLSSAKAKANQIWEDQDQKRHRKNVTGLLIGIQDTEKSENSFKPVGQLEPQDEQEKEINDSVFDVIEQNYEDFLQELKETKMMQQRQAVKVRATLLPSEKQKFDQDPEFKRQAIATAKENKKEDGGISSDEAPEPERQFDKLRARTTLKSIKKFEEDNLLEKQKQDKEQNGSGNGERLTSAQKKRKTHEPIKRRRSFSECQLKFEDGLEIYQNVKSETVSLTDKHTIIKMQAAKRFPIPESLLNRPEHYVLCIDSIIHNLYQVEFNNTPPVVKAPKNSDVSEDNLSASSEEVPYEQARESIVLDKQADPKQIDRMVVELQPYKLDAVGIFPHKARDGEVPLKLFITPDLQYLLIVSNALKARQQTDDKFRYSPVQIQTIFEYYCSLFKVQSLDIKRHIIPTDNQRIKLSFRNMQVSEGLCKSLALTIPFIYDIYEVEFVNNQVTDLLSTLLLLSAYINPSVKRFSFVSNHGRNTLRRTLIELCKENPHKITELNLSRSFTQLEIMEQVTRSFHYNHIVKLNISGNGLSINAARILNLFLLKAQCIKDLNFARCKLQNQSARYIADALNRNTTIRHLNLSNNDFGSSIYEFSIKIASMLTRHPTLMHADFSSLQLKREECMFVILAMSTSKNFVALHLTGNDLPYYERVFMRSLIAARVQFAQQNDGQQVRFNKERYQVMQLASQQYMLPDLKEYLKRFEVMEERREGLDFEISDLLQEINFEKSFNKVLHVTGLSELKPDSKIKRLIDKMLERNQELALQQSAVKEMMKLSAKDVRSRLDSVSGSVLNLTAKRMESQRDFKSSLVAQAQNDLKIERQRQRAELEVAKKKKDRSAGEMALLFMGINQVAYDLLIENPMTGYMNEIIFSRILGCEDIEQGNYWSDTTICYICAKWEKAVIRYNPQQAVSKWAQKIVQIDHLKVTIESIYHEAEEIQTKEQAAKDAERKRQQEFDKKRRKALGESSEDDAKQKKLKIVGLRPSKHSVDEATTPQNSVFQSLGPLSPRFDGKNGMIPLVSRQKSGKHLNLLTPKNFRARAVSIVDNGNFSQALDNSPVGQELKFQRQETPVDKVARPNKRQVNQENPLMLRALTIKNVQSHIFPEKFIDANDFQELNLRATPPQSPGADTIQIDNHDKYMAAKQMSRYGGPPGGMPGRKHMRDLTQQAITVNQSNRPPSPKNSVAPTVVTNIIQSQNKHIRGQPQKIQRTLFFQGIVYEIEEEIYSGSDNSSVYTSEDDFEEDTQMIKHYITMTDDHDARERYEAEQRKNYKHKKTEKELRLEKLGVIAEDKKELTEAQKEYKTKIWPRHYIPHLKEEKSKGLDMIGQDLGLEVAAELEDGTTATLQSGPDDGAEEITLVGSFNDWMPIKMKTLRQLTFEKLNPEEPIPKRAFVLDNKVQLHANYMPPGDHYFYFIKPDGTIVLAPTYQVCRLKTTNVFLNRITINPRVFDFDTVNVVKGGDEEAQVFLKDKSVFRDYRDDNRAHLKKCFDQDMLYTKVQRTVKGEEEVLEDIKELLFKHYVKINNIFLYYTGISTYPTISMNDFTSWSNKCNFIDGKWINLSTLDRILITTNVALHGLISSAERDLNRYEFLEIIVRLSIALYKESKVCETIPQAILKLLTENIFPNSKLVDGDQFRRFQCYNVKVNEILQKNQQVLLKIYDCYTHNKKRYITLPECREYIRKCEGCNVSEMQVGIIFAESMQTLVDTIIDQERPKQMKFVEFLVFLCRVAFEHYRGTPYETEMMYLKLEKMIPVFLGPVNLSPLFLFYEEFEYKPQVRKPRKVKVRVEDLPESEVSDDSSEEDDLGQFVMLEAGKLKLSAAYAVKIEKEKQEKKERKEKKAELRAQKLANKMAREQVDSQN